jgi:hypothetical protein
MSTGIRRVLAMSLATILMLALVWLITSNDQADATTENTCNDVGFTNLESDTSGAWGSVDFDSTEPTLTLVVEEGFEVRLCVKAGSVEQGDGPEVTGWFDEGTYEVAHSSGKELSHYGIEFRETTTSTSTPTSTTSTTVIGPPPPPPTTTTTSSSSSTTTLPPSTTTTSEAGSTTTAPPPSTTTTPEDTTSRASFVPTTTRRTPSPGDAGTLPFTGVEEYVDELDEIAAVLIALGGLAVLAVRVWKGRREDLT